MRLISRQRVVWEGEYLGTHLKIFDCVEEGVPIIAEYSLWLATDATGQTFVHYYRPTLQESGIWEGEEDNYLVLVAEFDVDDDFDPLYSLVEIEYSREPR